jgi:uncharacterized surface protein with fasciclin (FAS1) repeats
VFEHFVVEGQALTVEDMYDGMEVQSLAGYPLTIRLNPLRVNGVNVSIAESNVIFKNGLGHTLEQFPTPLVPYFGKSTFDVLLETNEMGNGNLSSFIALIEASPDFKNQLLLGEGDISNRAATLFVPTNEALAAADPALIADPDLLQNLLLNHIVSGNFVKHRWWVIPTGTKMSDTELRLETQAGQALNLTIIHDVVTINGDVSVIISDVFSEQGVLHVIDKLL